MRLKEIYRPIEKELKGAEGVIRSSLGRSKNRSISDVTGFLLDSPGKMIRPALFILSAKASLVLKSTRPIPRLTKIAAAMELIHMASLVHDDVIDHSRLRRGRPTVNSKWGEDISITLGDYLYSVAFELISECGNPDIIRCISSATKTMCEGELMQVCERDNLGLLKKRYIVIVKKKTASLFAASCQAGTLASKSSTSLQNALKNYGLNYGIAFQIIDDYLDLVGKEKSLGKKPGQDMWAGDVTLPVLNLLESVSPRERRALERLFNSKDARASLGGIKRRLFASGACLKTRAAASSFIDSAKEKITILPGSPYKRSLFHLADLIIDRGFSVKD